MIPPLLSLNVERRRNMEMSFCLIILHLREGEECLRDHARGGGSAKRGVVDY